MCDSYCPSTTPVNWHSTIITHLLTSLLSPSGLGFTSWPVVSHYVDTAAKCRRFLHVVPGAKKNFFCDLHNKFVERSQRFRTARKKLKICRSFLPNKAKGERSWRALVAESGVEKEATVDAI
jgi:hypothetical protein